MLCLRQTFLRALDALSCLSVLAPRNIACASNPPLRHMPVGRKVPRGSPAFCIIAPDAIAPVWRIVSAA